MLHLTIDVDMVARLRSVVVGACGDKLKFLRIEPMARSNKVKCWLCLTCAGIDLDGFKFEVRRLVARVIVPLLVV